MPKDNTYKLGSIIPGMEKASHYMGAKNPHCVREIYSPDVVLRCLVNEWYGNKAECEQILDGEYAGRMLDYSGIRRVEALVERDHRILRVIRNKPRAELESCVIEIGSQLEQLKKIRDSAIKPEYIREQELKVNILLALLD